MKKFSILVALILCVTISGVYAAWIYTGTTVNNVDRTLSHGMTVATSEGYAGILSITHNDVDVVIDQTAPGDYTALLKISGSVTVTFTPNLGAPDDIRNNAIPSEAIIYLKNVDANKYMGTPIYTVSEAAIPLTWSTPDENGVFTATITAAEIDSILDLGGTFVLDTHADYTAFHALEENITISLQIQQQAA